MVKEEGWCMSPSIEKSLKVKQIGASSRERTMSEGNPVSGKPQRGSKKDLKSPTAKRIKGGQYSIPTMNVYDRPLLRHFHFQSMLVKTM